MSDHVETLFESTTGPKPDWAKNCGYCRKPDQWGQWDQAQHDKWHRPVTCAICGQTEPNRHLAELSHVVNLGASYELGKVVCVALSLWLNHLTHMRMRGEPFPPTGDPQHPQDWRALELGWTISPTGEQIPPPGWPNITDRHECELLEVKP